MIDHLIVGGGLSGTCLAWALRDRVAAGETLVVVDHDPRPDDRTFAFFHEGNSPLDAVLLAEWRTLRVRDEAREVRVDLGRWRYCALSEAALREWVWGQLGPTAERRKGHVDALEDGEDRAVAHLGDERLEARWAYDSRPVEVPGLLESFEGAWVEVDDDAFDVTEAVLMDFRAPQGDGLAFFYVLPVTPRRAMVMGVQMGPTVAIPAVEDHLGRLLAGRSFEIRHREGGVIPLTDLPFERQGARVSKIGIPGGQIRPSTGYALTRILRDSTAIAAGVDRPVDPWRVRAMDSLMLLVMARHPGSMAPIFVALFANNPADRVLRFLDERPTWRDVLGILASLPPSRFLLALPLWLVGQRASR